jgi:hypothetical protein
MSNRRTVLDRSSEPASLYRVMQAMIGEGLREHYEVPQKMSHELFVLLMQMNERNTGAARRGAKADTLRKRQSDRATASSCSRKRQDAAPYLLVRR